MTDIDTIKARLDNAPYLLAIGVTSDEDVAWLIEQLAQAHSAFEVMSDMWLASSGQLEDAIDKIREARRGRVGLVSFSLLSEALEILSPEDDDE